MRAWRIPLVSLAVFGLFAAWATPVGAQVPPAPAKAATVDAAPLFRDILTRYYEAYSRKDLAAIETLWHPKGPARYTRNMLVVEFEMKTATLVDLSVTEASITPGGGRARAIIDLQVVDAKTRRERRERRVREITFFEDEGTWKIWNDGAGGLGLQIAGRLLDAAPGQRATLIANDPEVRSDDTLAGVGLHVNRLRSQGKYSDVIDALSVRTALARALGDESVVAASLLDTGLTYQVTGQPDAAGKAYVEARALYEKLGSKPEVAMLDSNLAAVAYLLGDYAGATERYRQALEFFDAASDKPRAASALHGVGNALYMQGEFEAAMSAYQRCLAIHDASGDKYSASSVLQAMALVHKEVGNNAAALEAYARSATLSADAKDTVGNARAEHGQGEVQRLLGDYGRALQHFAASLASWQKVDDPVNRAATMYATGQVHALQRSFSRALEWYQRALEIDQAASERAAVARDLGGMGGAHAGQGRLEEALDDYRKSLAIREELKDTAGTMWTVVHIGVLQSMLAQHSDALQSYQRALGIAEPTGDAGAVCTILALRAANELSREDADSALASATKAAEIAARLEMFDVLANAKVTAGKVQRKTGHLADAIASLQEAVTAVERVPVGPGVETFFDDRRSPYLALIDLLVTEKDAPPSRLADALLLWERARTRNLAAMLGGDGAVVVKDMTQAERDEERQLSRAVKTLGVRVKRERGRAKPDAERVAALLKDLERAQAERAGFRQKLFAAHPALAALRAQADPAPVEAAGRLLAGAEALVSFIVTEQKTHILAVAEGSAGQAGRVVYSGTADVKASDLAAKVTLFREAIAKRDERTAQIGRELYDALLAPIRDPLKRAKTVIVVPDAFLWALPFEALQDDRGRFLVQDLAVSYAPSLTALAAMRDAQGVEDTRRPALLAVADPAVPAAALERLSLVRPPAAPGFPAGGHEARALALVFGPQASQVATKDQARAARAAAVQRGAAVHLAVPGSLLDTSPLFSLLAFSPAAADDADQGLTEIGDMMGWTMPASLVAFTRLDSAGGNSGDSLTALAWMLHIAGAESVVVNRWLPDETDSKLLTGFYRAWLSRPTPTSARPSPAVAMQKAARNLITAPGSKPADWAGFMVMGR